MEDTGGISHLLNGMRPPAQQRTIVHSSNDLY